MADPFRYSNPEIFVGRTELNPDDIEGLGLNERGELVGWVKLHGVTDIQVHSTLEIDQWMEDPDD